MASGPRRPRRDWRRWQAAADTVGYEEFDPLDRVNLGRSLETALLSRPCALLTDVPPFWGSGIYAIYFRGSGAHPLYGAAGRFTLASLRGQRRPRGRA
jgi:hypothetical protein